MRQPTRGAMSPIMCATISLALASYGYGQACEVLDDQLIFFGPFANPWSIFPPSVSVDGDWAVVGSSNPGNPGKAYVIPRDNDAPPGTPAWGTPVQLIPTDPLTGNFGKSVAIRGDVAIMGQPGNPGAAHIFRLTDGQWAHEAKLLADGPSGTFANAVDIEGDVAVISKSSSPASAQVFRKVDGVWQFEQSLVVVAASPTAVSLAGNRIAIGTSGIVGLVASVFQYNGTQWVEEAQLTTGTTPAASIDIHGDRVVVGAPPRSYAFAFDGTSWNLAQTLGPFGGLFGASVALDGDVLLVGAPDRNPETVYNPQCCIGNHGSIYKYRWEQTQWALDYILVSGRSGRVGGLGRSIAISGDSIITSGLERGLSNSGYATAAYAFSTQAPDCNNNGIPDRCDAPDCDNNSRVDLCPLSEPDCNSNGIPDHCEADATYVLDDGQAYAAFIPGTTQTQPLDFLWMNQFNVVQAGQIITHIDIAWNGFASEGHPVKLLIYDDPNNDGNPEDAALISTFDFKTRAYGDDYSEVTFTRIEIPPTYVGQLGESFFIGAIATHDSNGYGTFFADDTPSPGRSWFYVSIAGAGDYKDPAGTMQFHPGSNSWDLMLRALAFDCNGNGTWDQCDIDSGLSADVNANGIPDECESSCAADIAPSKGNGAVDVDDLLNVINAWGVCEQGQPCEADIAPPGPPQGDGVVNANDLLFIISNWGPCV